MHQSRPALEVQLLFDLRAVDIHSSGADVQLLGNFVGRVAAPDELKNRATQVAWAKIFEVQLEGQWS